MSDAAVSWADRAADRSPRVQRSRERSIEQAQLIVEAAQRLITGGAEEFTTQELVKEAGVALQTFYRYFGGKDELLLAVIEDMIASACEEFAAQADEFENPVDRLRSIVLAVAGPLATPGNAPGRFIASEHWRLAKLFPDEISAATRPYADLVATEIRAGCEAGTLCSADPDRDAWFIGQLVMSVHHHHSFVDGPDPTLGDDLWRFCLASLGGAS
ncbi:MAG: TetR/AcrR family transcriptional regulator [Acidimicrobiales bacterium]|nr:TetR/AcrR family transcriptional regulator [Acidimicrobiales bacterium]